MKKKLLVSVITVVFNGKEYIEETIKSVINQTYENIEYIVIDGGSTDGTIDIIRKYEDRIAYWVSEGDDGISDAFNKGIRNSKGSYILMLNAGDVFLKDNILVDNIENFDNKDLVVFHTYIKGTTQIMGIDTFKNISLKQQARLPHQGTFVHKRMYEQYGVYDKNYRIRMDYDFFLRFVGKCDVLFIHKGLVCYDNSGISGQLKYRFLYEKEAVLSEYKNLDLSSIYLIKLIYKPIIMTILSWVKNNVLSMKGR